MGRGRRVGACVPLPSAPSTAFFSLLFITRLEIYCIRSGWQALRAYWCKLQHLQASRGAGAACARARGWARARAAGADVRSPPPPTTTIPHPLPLPRLNGSPPNNGTVGGQFILNQANSLDPTKVHAPYQKTPSSPVFEWASIYRMSPDGGWAEGGPGGGRGARSRRGCGRRGGCALATLAHPARRCARGVRPRPALPSPQVQTWNSLPLACATLLAWTGILTLVRRGGGAFVGAARG